MRSCKNPYFNLSNLFSQCLFILGFFIGITSLVNAQKTFTKDIAKIIYNKCASCHRPGEIGPFSLTNYQEIRNKAFTIKAVTGNRSMPPWKADPTYKHFLGENTLSQEQINAIAEWVDAGAPYGNATEEPKFPVFPASSALGKPDLVVSFAASHTHIGDNKDSYRYFVIPTNMPKTMRIKAVEVRPGNPKIVHHALIFQDTAGAARSYDQRTPEYGFAGTSGFSDEQVIFYDQYPGFAPGQKPLYFPDGLGQILTKGADLVIQMHYAPNSVTQKDSTTINLFFAKDEEKVERILDDYIMLPFNLVPFFTPFNIPRNTTRTFEGRWTLSQKTSLVGIFPHMHMLGKKWEVWLERPDKTKENLIRINDWDFNWQSNYYFERFIIAPAGSVIVARASYDNTTSNPKNPTIPPRDVGWGERTIDEMFYLPILHVPYKSGDEFVIFSETNSNEDEELDISINQIMEVSPNPAKGELINVKFAISKGQPLNINILDMTGRLIRSLRSNEFFSKGNHYVNINSAALSSGMYIVNISGGEMNMSKQFQVAN